MDGVLCLNQRDPVANAPFGAHDPGMLWDAKTACYYSYSTDVWMPQLGLNDPIGIPVRTSPNLVHFTYRGTVLSPEAVAEGRDNGAYPPTRNFWAPFAELVGSEYRLYYAATRAFGSSESRIWLATADNPLGPFRNRGIVVDTWGTDDSLPNAIDPHVLRSPEGVYLVYGSFFGGIYLKELDDTTGLPVQPPNVLGRCISHKQANVRLDGPEGAAVLYRPENECYYLFQSYGWLGDGYDIRVGRAKYPWGPYLDRDGHDLRGVGLGCKLAGSYRFCADAPNAVPGDGWQWGGLRGLGHGVPFYDPVRQSWFFVHHVRDGAVRYRTYDSVLHRWTYPDHYLMVRPMFFLEDGWPVLGPEPFSGEDLTPISAPSEARTWELLVMDDEDNEQRHSALVTLSPEDSLLRHSVFYRCRDFENGGKPLLVFTGLREDGAAVWGKLRENN